MIRLLGNSSASIEFFLDSSEKFVRKTCFGESGHRLVKQIEKQKNYVPFNRVIAPKIFSVSTSREKTVVDMEFVRGLDFVTYTSSVSIDEFKNTFELLISLIEKEFKDSCDEVFPINIWKAKIENLISTLLKREDIDKNLLHSCRLHLLSDLPKSIKIGKCHGDLTFSNMIVSEESQNLYVFDFLDPPIETPYEDMSKLLQDAEFFWSLQKYVGNCDTTRVKIIWSYFSKILKKRIQHDEKILKKFQVLGMLRIAPYTREFNNVLFIQDSLRKLIECY